MLGRSVRFLFIFSVFCFVILSLLQQDATDCATEPPPHDTVSTAERTAERPTVIERPTMQIERNAPPVLNCQNVSFMPLRLASRCVRTQFDVRDLQQSGDSGIHAPADGRMYCELALLHSQLCQTTEGASDCIARVGQQRLERVLARRCTLSHFFRTLTLQGSNTHDVRSGMILDAMIDGGNRISYVQPSDRPVSHNIPFRRVERFKCSINRITMGIPLENIVSQVSRDKLFDVYPLQPISFPFAPNSKYSFGSNDEAILREALSRSFFAVTHRRACWSAQRHFDALASGVIPLFVDLHLAFNPEIDLPMFPTDLVLAARKLRGVSELFHPAGTAKFVDLGTPYLNHRVFNLRSMPTINLANFDIEGYYQIAEALLAYTRANLTTIAVASHFLRTMGHEDAKTVVFFQNYFLPEANTLIHGLASLGLDVYTFGGSVPTLIKFPPGTTEEEAAKRRDEVFWRGFRGAGHSYGMRAPRSHVHSCGDDRCFKMIKERKVDLVMYSVNGPLQGGETLQNDEIYPHLPTVRELYTTDRVAFIDGNDAGNSFLFQREVCQMGVLFTREKPLV